MMTFTENIKQLILKLLTANQRDMLAARKRLHLGKRIHPDKQLFIMTFDGKFFHGGLTDRLKGIISTFHFCQCEGIDFRIRHIHPFNLEDYLLPNEYDWRLKENDPLSFHWLETKFANLIGKNLFQRLKNLHTGKQIHCYANWNIVPELNAYYHTTYTWGNLFRKLFRPSEELLQQIRIAQQQIGGEYVCVVFRFQQLLGDFKEYEYEELSDNDKEILKNKCRKAILDLQESQACQRILVTSDSTSFLRYIAPMEHIFVFTDEVVHMDTVKDASYQTYVKSFFDFYMLSEGIKIFSIGINDMYKTEFPLYAAQLNNIPFERIFIE